MLVVKVTQLTGVTARHEHSRATEIESVPVPPPGPNDAVEPETFASQRFDAGAVIFVDVVAELPQAAASAAAPTQPASRKARVLREARVFTAGL